MSLARAILADNRRTDSDGAQQPPLSAKAAHVNELSMNFLVVYYSTLYLSSR
jgi:hypothetical protein